MFRIAKPESLVLFSPSKDDVGSPPPCRESCTQLRIGLGRKAERCGVHPVDYGAEVRFLQQPIARPGFPILIPFDHDRVQLLLLDLSGSGGGLQGAE